MISRLRRPMALLPMKSTLGTAAKKTVWLHFGLFFLLLRVMSKKQRIAIYQLMFAGRNRRGPHIFFPWFFAKYQESLNSAFDLFYFIKTNDEPGVRKEFNDRGIPLDRVVFLPVQNNRFKAKIEMWQLSKAIRKHKINLLQALAIDSPDEQIPQMEKLAGRVKLGFTVTYNGIPTAFTNDYDERFEKNRAKYGRLFRQVQFDGLLSWYDDVESFVASSDIFSKKPFVYTIKSRFCDASRFYPKEKENTIVFASALVNYKHPMMFLKALNMVFSETPELLDGWKVQVIGTGPEEKKVLDFISDNALGELIEVTSGLSDISPILRKSRVYISAQEIENFPSLAMNEAMAAGNAIIARNVGRTHLFVKDGENGFLTQTDDYQGIAKALQAYLSDESLQKRFENRSIELCKTVHTPENFNRQIDEFWTRVLSA